MQSDFPSQANRTEFLYPGKTSAFVSLILILTGCLLFFRFAYAKDEGNNPAAKRHAVVISVDGLPPDLYLHPDKYGLKIPNIRRLRAEGSYAEAVEGVYPSATYPSQTTLVTGRWPREHGVYTNFLSREAGKRTSDRYWFAEAIRVPTLWDWVREAGLTTAAVSWPVSTGAEIDWNVPEIRDTSPRRLPIWQITAEHSRPRGLLEEAFRAVGEPRRGEHTDDVRARVANYIFKTYRPNLLLLHLIALDLSQHRFGPGSKEAREAMEKVDGMVGELISTVEQAGLAGQTAFFVVSDHGMLPVRHYLYPNTLLARAGLLNVGERGRITGGRIATTSNGGSFFIYWPSEADGELRERVDRALAPMRQAGAFWGLFGAEAMADLKADGGACLALDAARGYAFMPRATGHWRGESPRLTGTHGNHPMRPGLEASFLAAGPGLRHAINLGRVQMLSVAPTLARYFQISGAGGNYEPAWEEIFTRAD